METTIFALLLTLNIAMFIFGPILIFLLQKQIKGDQETKEMYVDVIDKIEDNFQKEQVFMDKLENNEKVNTEIFNQIGKEFGRMQERVITVGDNIITHTGKEDGRWESIDTSQKESYKILCKLEENITKQ